MSLDDERPPVWIGHVALRVRSVGEMYDFMAALGMRPIAREEAFAVLELRGGTHLVILPDEQAAGGVAPFDLMVDDIEATHRALTERGLAPSPIQQTPAHLSFTVKAPSGWLVPFNSSHVSDKPV
jgi:catechol 2,3-dioxygenase-like lactoylglutathione lyase family enzyme